MPPEYSLFDLDRHECRTAEEVFGLERYAPWGISPATFLEIQLPAESGRLKSRPLEFIEAVKADTRFVVDDVAASVLFQL